METEVKLRLPNSAAHQKLSSILSPHHTKTHLQQNHFFDTSSLTLATQHLTTLRLRFYNIDSKAIISLKSKPQLTAGISRVEEHEEQIDTALAHSCITEPWRFGTLVDTSKVLKRVVDEYGVGLNELVCLGGFRNVRSVYELNGLKLELDETLFEFGVCYEVECESDEPDEAKLRIEEMLKSNGIRFCYSQGSKFSVFRSGVIPEFKCGVMKSLSLKLEKKIADAQGFKWMLL
ncbi:hypothetical protein QVD17_21196 [Tagetes erecta]|uniref:CYTH domain-containing protein n=1 Tax=Tagetes erecta TaxID=13708 RepID=A0AAD8NRN2_TARER|nr:hypothetical protein QVD17_21196 [Tagetes erecta]